MIRPTLVAGHPTLLAGLIAQSSWPASAVHDTVAAIVAQPAYQRSVRATLFERLLDWLAALIRRFLSAVNEVPYAKWVVLGLAIAVVLAIAMRVTLGASGEERRRRAGVGRVTGVGDAWAEAERLAAAGDYTEAAHLLYRGVIERLAAGEQLRVHPSKTSGDYARELLRRGSGAHAEFRQFGRRYDRVLFGVGSCDAPTYAMLRDLAARIVAGRERAA